MHIFAFILIGWLYLLTGLSLYHGVAKDPTLEPAEKVAAGIVSAFWPITLSVVFLFFVFWTLPNKIAKFFTE